MNASKLIELARSSLKETIQRYRAAILVILPQRLRFILYRNLLRLPNQEIRKVQFKIAETKNEIEQALQLVHRRYMESGLVDKKKVDIRITKYHLSPRSVILIGVEDGRVLCTLTIVIDGAVGLPVEQVSELTKFKKSHYKLAEISSLSIDHTKYPKWVLLFNLMKYMWIFVTTYTSVNALVCAVNQKTAEFYQGLLLFEKLETKKDSKYSFVKDDCPLPLFLDLNQAKTKYENIYGNMSEDRNLYGYFLGPEGDNFNFPKKPYYMSLHNVLSPELIHYFFSYRSQVLDNLDPREKSQLAGEFYYSQYKAIIDPKCKLRYLYKRQSPRFDLFSAVKVDGSPLTGYVVSISRDGIQIKLNEELPDSIFHKLEFDISVEQGVSLIVNKVWQLDGLIGFKIESSESAWIEYINTLESKLGILIEIPFKEVANGH